jgi:hypothetical protein
MLPSMLLFSSFVVVVNVILVDLFSFYRNTLVFSLISSMTEDKLDPFDHGRPTNEGKIDRLPILKRSTPLTILDPLSRSLGGLIP